MSRQAEIIIATSIDFTLPVEWKLAEDNRWVVMSKLIPWDEFEGVAGRVNAPKLGVIRSIYHQTFSASPVRKYPRLL